MEAQSAEPTPFQKFEALTRRVMSVPKAEIDRRAKAARKQREERKKNKTS
jgi:hypothetical protein